MAFTFEEVENCEDTNFLELMFSRCKKQVKIRPEFITWTIEMLMLTFALFQLFRFSMVLYSQCKRVTTRVNKMFDDSEYIPYANSEPIIQLKAACLVDGVTPEAAMPGVDDFAIQVDKFPRDQVYIAWVPEGQNLGELERQKLTIIGEGIRDSNGSFVTPFHVADKIGGLLVLSGHRIGKSVVIPVDQFQIEPISDIMDLARITLRKTGYFNTLGITIARLATANPTQTVSLFRRSIVDGSCKLTVSHSTYAAYEPNPLYFKQRCNSAPGNSGCAIRQKEFVVGVLIGSLKDGTSNLAAHTLMLMPAPYLARLKLRLSRMDDTQVSVKPETPTDEAAARREAEAQAYAAMRSRGEDIDDQGFRRKKGSDRPEGHRSMSRFQSSNPLWADIDEEVKVNTSTTLVSDVNFRRRHPAAQQKSLEVSQPTTSPIQGNGLVLTVDVPVGTNTSVHQPAQQSSSSSESPDILSKPLALTDRGVVLEERSLIPPSDSSNGLQVPKKQRNRKRKTKSSPPSSKDSAPSIVPL